MIKTIHGDLIALADQGMFDCIIQGCNCQNKMGAGIAKSIVAKWPLVYNVDTNAFVNDSKNPFKLLGDFSMCKVPTTSGHDLIICNAYTQLNYGRGIQVDYNAIRNSFKKISECIPTDYKIGMPMIGAGLGGGDWNIILEIIDDMFYEHDITVVRFKQV